MSVGRTDSASNGVYQSAFREITFSLTRMVMAAGTPLYVGTWIGRRCSPGQKCWSGKCAASYSLAHVCAASMQDWQVA